MGMVWTKWTEVLDYDLVFQGSRISISKKHKKPYIFCDFSEGSSPPDPLFPLDPRMELVALL